MKNKKVIIIGNLKQNPARLQDAIKLAGEYKNLKKKNRNILWGMAAPMPFLYELNKKYGKDIPIYAQTISSTESGAYTGEASAAQVVSTGIKHTVIGHSERRNKGETNEIVSKQVTAAVSKKMDILLCVGEKERHEDMGYIRFVNDQLESALAYVKKTESKKISIAYEPVWAIGQHALRSANENEIYEMTIAIRKKLVEMFGKTAGTAIPILYGGSVNSKNCADILKVHHIDGFLLGRASLDPKELQKIVEIIQAQ